MSSSITPAVLAAVSKAGSTSSVLTAIVLCVRHYLRYRAERERWSSTERLAERHGLEALTVLPQLARELRDDRRRDPEVDQPAATRPVSSNGTGSDG